MEQCLLFGIYEFPGGNCAQWFSGTASAIAVMVALGGYAYTEWRYRSQIRSKDAEELASIFSLLRAALEEAESVSDLLSTEEKIEWMEEEFELLPPFLAIQPDHFDRLDKSQARFLISNRLEGLLCKIDNMVALINNTNNAIEDYSRRREEILFLMDRIEGQNPSGTIRKKFIEDKKHISEQANRLVTVSAMLKQLGRTMLEAVIETCAEFNDLDKSRFHEECDLQLDLSSVQAQLRG
ncbi:MAG: hypothetical protein QOE79_1790 [Sphingomonadales bacterium]|jgi:DNA-binding FrmR family transcriptional regulator|nr:hypothetical protein [Sphingomonadales bacterium]